MGLNLVSAPVEREPGAGAMVLTVNGQAHEPEALKRPRMLLVLSAVGGGSA